MTNNRYISKDVQQIALLSVLLIVQILVLTKLVKYDKIRNNIGIHDDSEIDVSQPRLETTTELSSECETTAVTTSSPPNLDLDGSGEINDVDYGKLVEYNLNPNRERPENIKTIYDTLDYDKDGDVDPDEWDKYIRESN